MTKNRLFILLSFIFLSLFSEAFSKEWQRVYLASYPRSGNHWIRYLIEEASHIATSAVYCDKEPQHLDKVFPWGGYCCDHGYEGNCRYPTKNDIVLIKTHFPDRKTKFDGRPCHCVIRIVRHPIDSFYSRYVKNPHGELLDTVPSDRVKELIQNWRKFQTYWNKQQDVITIRYEDILENPTVELKRICAILNYDVTDEDIARAIAMHPPVGGVLKHINRFSSKDLHLIAEELGELMAQYGYSIPL
jgi:hypothetical protein